MTTQQLPGQPNLEQLKRQAKDLLRSAKSQEPAALQRMRSLPAFASLEPNQIASAAFALHDAQSVVAREYGFVSWNALRERVEELTLQFADALQEFVLAATDGRVGRAERLLALHPRIPQASFPAALLLGDVERVETFLHTDAALAGRKGGAREWEPLLYVCHSSLGQSKAANADGFVTIARRLIALGADPNSRFPWFHHGVQRAVLWGAVCVTRSLPLAQVLLQAGANPNDGVTLTIAASGGDLPALELLIAHGADVNFPWATDGSSPLYSILGWSRKAAGPVWLLEQGADPRPAFGKEAETALHVAARKWDVPLVEALVRHGADVTARRADGRTAYVLAELNNNVAVAEWLLAHGSPTDITEFDRFVAACSRGDRRAAEAALAAHPELRAEIKPEHHVALREAAERGDAQAIETMLACGFDANVADEGGRTALHRAARGGCVNAVRVLLECGARTDVLDQEFNATPLLWAADGARMGGAPGPDHTAVAKLLIRAGSPTDWQPTKEPSERLLEILAEWTRASASSG